MPLSQRRVSPSMILATLQRGNFYPFIASTRRLYPFTTFAILLNYEIKVYFIRIYFIVTYGGLMKNAFFGTVMDEQLVAEAKFNMEKRLKQPISKAAMFRTLVGLMAENKIEVDITDVVEHSPGTYMYQGFKKKEDAK
jgi:hypothetical protein